MLLLNLIEYPSSETFKLLDSDLTETLIGPCTKRSTKSHLEYYTMHIIFDEDPYYEISSVRNCGRGWWHIGIVLNCVQSLYSNQKYVMVKHYIKVIKDQKIA